MFLSFRERGNRGSTNYQLAPDMKLEEAKEHGTRVIRARLDRIDPLLFSRAVAVLRTASGLVVSRIYLSTDRRLAWEDTNPDKLSGDQKKEMVRLLGFRSVNEYERKKMRDRGEFYYD